MQRNCTNRRTLLHKFWERSQNFCNKVRRLVQFRRTKLTAVTSTTYETLKNTAGYLNEHRQQIQSVNDKLRSDIKNYNNWLTKIIELKTDLKTATLDIIKIVSEFTFLFWLDNFEHINEKRIHFGETFPEEISHLCDELQIIWNSEHYSEHFESTLKICSDSINFIEGLLSHVKITDLSQTNITYQEA